jgi:hypothetical protein
VTASSEGERTAAAVAVLAAALCAACGGPGSSGRAVDLVHEVRGYGDGLRWRDFAAAAQRIAPVRRAEFLDQRDQLDQDLRVADWEMMRVSYKENRDRAEVQVEYTWLLDSRGIVHTTVARQSWARHGSKWLLEGEVRLRGDPMPGLAEPGGQPERNRSERHLGNVSRE